MLTAARNDLYRPPGSIGQATPWTNWGPARLGDTRPGTARRGFGRLTDLRKAMSAFRLFMSAYRPGPDVADSPGGRGVLTLTSHSLPRAQIRSETVPSRVTAWTAKANP